MSSFYISFYSVLCLLLTAISRDGPLYDRARYSLERTDSSRLEHTQIISTEDHPHSRVFHNLTVGFFFVINKTLKVEWKRFVHVFGMSTIKRWRFFVALVEDKVFIVLSIDEKTEVDGIINTKYQGHIWLKNHFQNTTRFIIEHCRGSDDTLIVGPGCLFYMNHHEAMSKVFRLP